MLAFDGYGCETTHRYQLDAESFGQATRYPEVPMLFPMVRAYIVDLIRSLRNVTYTKTS